MDSQFPILIVEEDEDDRLCLVKAFDYIKKSQLVRFFISGHELLKYIDTLSLHQQPALLVLDHNITGSNGKETLKRIREHDTHNGVPAVVFSTGSTAHVQHEMDGLNVLTYLQKSPCFNKLIEQVSFFSELVADDVDTLLGSA